MIAIIKEICDTVALNYGLIGREWIECIKNHSSIIKSTYLEVKSKLMEEFTSKVPLHVMNIATITTANIIFDVFYLEKDMNDSIELEMNCSREIIKTLPENLQISDCERIKPLIIDWIDTHPKNFSDTFDSDSYGVKRDKFIAIYPTVLHNFIKEYEMVPEILIRQLADDGFTERSKDELKKVVKISGKPKKLYVILIEKLEIE